MKKIVLILAIFLLLSNWCYPQNYRGINSSKIRGLNCYTNITEKDIDSVKKWGGNSLRIMLMIHDLYNLSEYNVGPKKIDSEKLDRLEEVVELCRDNQITAIIDLHEVPGLVRWSGWKDFRLWEQNKIGDNCRNLLIETWKKLAKTFEDYPDNSVAYELLNEAEPKENDWNASETKSKGKIWSTLQSKLVTEIRKIDTIHTIICSPPYSWRVNSLTTWTPSKVLLEDKKIMLAVHMYSPLDYTLQWDTWYNGKKASTYPGYFADNTASGSQKILWNKQQLRLALSPVAEFQKKYPEIPIIITEFSVMRILPGAAQYLNDLIDVFRELKVGWTYHVFREADYLNQFNDCPDTMFELNYVPKGGRKAATTDSLDRYKIILNGFKN